MFFTRPTASTSASARCSISRARTCRGSTATDLVALARVVAATLEPYARAGHVDVAVEASGDPLIGLCDPALLEEVLLELAGNALRAMTGRPGSLRVALHRERSRAVIEVSDTGPGIPEGVRDRVFELFFTTRPDGTGMGLATVKKIVESHGGQVDVTRTGPDGTTFRIEVPRCPSPYGIVGATPRNPSARAASSPSMRPLASRSRFAA